MATAAERRTSTARDDATLEHLPVNHRRGCPRERIESFLADLPRSPQFPVGGKVQTTRCVDCGRDNHADTDIEETITDG